MTDFVHKGYNGWKNLGTYIKSHENSPQHIDRVLKWLDLEMRLELNTTLNAEMEGQLKVERKRWTEVLETIFSVIEYVATHNLAFCGVIERMRNQIIVETL